MSPKYNPERSVFRGRSYRKGDRRIRGMRIASADRADRR